MEHLTKLVVYLTDIRHREAVYRTMGQYIKGIHPACTGLVVVAPSASRKVVLRATPPAVAVIPKHKRVSVSRIEGLRPSDKVSQRLIVTHVKRLAKVVNQVRLHQFADD